MPRNAVVTRAVADCVESDATDGAIDDDHVEIGGSVAALEAYGDSQQDYADSIDGGDIAGGAAVGAVLGIVVL